MAFRRTKDGATTSAEAEEPLETYDVTYRGGLPQLPKSKIGKIEMQMYSDHFRFNHTTGSKKFWSDLELQYKTITDVEILARNVSTFEAVAGGLNSRQLNQKNNIHIAYTGPEGEVHLRLEMLSGVTVMGQAKKCVEFEDRLRNLHIREQFAANTSVAGARNLSVADELNRLVALRTDGVLSDEEFAAANARLLGA